MKIAFTIFTMLIALNVRAQNAHFTEHGVVEYEKSINIFALLKKNTTKNNEYFMKQVYEQYTKSQPQFRVLKSTLSFSKNSSLYTPLVTDNVAVPYLNDDPSVGQVNVIYTDFLTNTSTCQKTVFEETFLVKDSTRNITWKITDEKRDIAGYSCRRANALVMDSIYVVAFYTEEIPVSGGPESFTGLPGMILGLALPHENTTWFATKVTDKAVADNLLSPPAKGKPVNTKTFKTTLESALKNWGSYARSYLKGFML